MVLLDLILNDYKLPSTLFEQPVYIVLDKTRPNGSGLSIIFYCKRTDQSLHQMELPEHFTLRLLQEYLEGTFHALGVPIRDSYSLPNIQKGLTRLDRMRYTYQDQPVLGQYIPQHLPTFRVAPETVNALRRRARIAAIERNETANIDLDGPVPNGDAPAVQPGRLVDEPLVPDPRIAFDFHRWTTTVGGPGLTWTDVQRAPRTPTEEDEYIPGDGAGDPQRDPGFAIRPDTNAGDPTG